LTQPTPEFDTASAVTVGRIGAPHGIRGELKVEPLTDFPERFEPNSRLYLGDSMLVVQASRWRGRSVYVKFRGIDDRNAAAGLTGRELRVPQPRQLTEADVYYQHDIVGLEVESEGGERIGRIEQIFSTGPNDVYVVRGESGELLLPAIDDVIKQVDLPGKRIVVELLPGLEFTAAAGSPRAKGERRGSRKRARS
jgi:16S rRNA processing protein RimM